MNKLAEQALKEAAFSVEALAKYKFKRLEAVFDRFYAETAETDALPFWQKMLKPTGLSAEFFNGNNLYAGDLVLDPEGMPDDQCYWTPDGSILRSICFGTFEPSDAAIYPTIQAMHEAWGRNCSGIIVIR